MTRKKPSKRKPKPRCKKAGKTVNVIRGKKGLVNARNGATTVFVERQESLASQLKAHAAEMMFHASKQGLLAEGRLEDLRTFIVAGAVDLLKNHLKLIPAGSHNVILQLPGDFVAEVHVARLSTVAVPEVPTHEEISEQGRAGIAIAPDDDKAHVAALAEDQRSLMDHIPEHPVAAQG